MSELEGDLLCIEEDSQSRFTLLTGKSWLKAGPNYKLKEDLDTFC